MLPGPPGHTVVYAARPVPENAVVLVFCARKDHHSRLIEKAGSFAKAGVYKASRSVSDPPLTAQPLAESLLMSVDPPLPMRVDPIVFSV